MAHHRPDLAVTSGELELGWARRACPYCDMPLLIRVPSMSEAAHARNSPALRLGLDELTPLERRVFDSIFAQFPLAVSTASVAAELTDMGPESIRQHVHNLRHKIAKRGWVLLTWKASWRLIEPTRIVA